jgi:thiol-disulfide isomerase/thioredoxin
MPSPTTRKRSPMSIRIYIATLLLLAAAALILLRDGATAYDLAGRPFNPLATRARATVLLFVGPDCPISNRYAPEIRRLAESYGNDEILFYLIYVDPNLDSKSIQQHLRAFSYDLPALRDPQHTLVERAEALTTPQAALFDRAGALVYSGRIDDRYIDFGKQRPAARTHDLEAALQAVLAGRAPSVSRTRSVGCYIADLKE